jgi:hypothetical protein
MYLQYIVCRDWMVVFLQRMLSYGPQKMWLSCRYMDMRRVIESHVLGVPWPIEWTLALVYETVVWWINIVNVWWVGTEVVQVATLLNYVWEVPISNLDQDANYCDSGFLWHSSFPPGKREIILQIRPFSALSWSFHWSCHHTIWHYIVCDGMELG